MHCGRFLSGWEDTSPYLTSLTLFGTDGRVVCTSAEAELPYTASDQEWFVTVKQEQRFALSDYTEGRTGIPILVAGSPLVSPDGSLIGVVALGISLNWLDFLTRIDLPPGGTVTALGPEGQVFSHRGANESEPSPAPSEFALQLIRMEESGTLRAKDGAGEPRVYGFRNTEDGGVRVVVGLQQFIEYRKWGGALLDTLIAPISVLLLALGAAGWASEAFVTRHVRSLISTADDIASGDLSARSEISYDEHEIGELAAAVDDMANALETNHSALEERLSDSEMIAAEMRHRLGNSLAVVQAIARQTSDHSATAEEFYTEFSGRLRSLAASNQLLSENRWGRVTIRDLLEAVLAAHSPQDGHVLELEGPDVSVYERAAMALTMAIHELATNAAKYGALSAPGGEVRISWSVGDEEPESWLTLEWRERCVARAAGDAHHGGFGSKLLESLIGYTLNGEVDRCFDAEGLVCRLSFPLSQKTDGE